MNTTRQALALSCALLIWTCACVNSGGVAEKSSDCLTADSVAEQRRTSEGRMVAFHSSRMAAVLAVQLKIALEFDDAQLLASAVADFVRAGGSLVTVAVVGADGRVVLQHPKEATYTTDPTRDSGVHQDGRHTIAVAPIGASPLLGRVHVVVDREAMMKTIDSSANQ